ncbi:MAG TPA: 6,7-dimethyl-8-ribityllumazine synthase [Bryobacteraceae bacterium]
MSAESVSWNEGLPGDARGLKFAIVVARFHTAVTEAMLSCARQSLEDAGAEALDIFHVPGSFELPLAVKLLAQRRVYHAIVALGAVIRGETPHFDFVSAEAARGLQQVALETGVPVAFGVLTTDTLQQAQARISKGRDAALAAIEMARLAAAL